MPEANLRHAYQTGSSPSHYQAPTARGRHRLVLRFKSCPTSRSLDSLMGMGYGDCMERRCCSLWENNIELLAAWTIVLVCASPSSLSSLSSPSPSHLLHLVAPLPYHRPHLLNVSLCLPASLAGVRRTRLCGGRVCGGGRRARVYASV